MSSGEAPRSRRIEAADSPFFTATARSFQAFGRVGLAGALRQQRDVLRNDARLEARIGVDVALGRIGHARPPPVLPVVPARLAVIGRLALPVQAATSRTCAITSSRGTAAAIFARGSMPARSRVTKETSASGSAPGVSSAATALPRPLSISRRAGLNFGTLAESSEVVSDRFEATRTNGRTRTISRSPARVVVEMRITWRAALVSPERGSLSVLRVACATRSLPVSVPRSAASTRSGKAAKFASPSSAI